MQLEVQGLHSDNLWTHPDRRGASLFWPLNRPAEVLMLCACAVRVHARVWGTGPRFVVLGVPNEQEARRGARPVVLFEI